MISLHSSPPLTSQPGLSPQNGVLASNRASAASAAEGKTPDEVGAQRQVLESLASHIPGMSVEGLKALDPAQYTPDKVAGRISSFVASGLENARARGRSEEDIQRLYDSAVQGAEKGFREARDILSGLDVLNGRIAEQVDETERLTFDALAGLNPSRAAQDAGALGATRSIAAAERFQQSERMELSLRTRDGDEVTIQFARDFDQQASFAAVADGNGNQAASFDVSSTESSGYRFQVKGDLSAEELDAIRNLVQDTTQLAGQFFNGDVQAAFEQAQNISFDSSQLARMELNMSSSTRYTAAQRYQETQQLADTSQNQPGRRLGQFMREMQDRFSQPGLEFLENAMGSGANLLQGLVEQDSRFQTADAEQQALYREQLGRLFDALAPNRLMDKATPETSALNEPREVSGE